VVSAWDFIGTDRFEVLRRIGAGGMGVVYEARDRARGGRVALKVLKQLEASTLLRFKQEFRSLADVNHPNLVGLHELICQDDVWFVTMELVEGISFLRWVRPGAPESPGLAAATTSGPDDTMREVSAAVPPTEVATALPPLDEERLRYGLHQLATGVAALHGRGKLHRDIKPSNVLVTADGRVVLLDFGLVKELVPDRGTESLNVIVGTPAYMAPEQAVAGAVAEASDWYAVGVMLYEALTGELPFAGEPMQILIGKQQREAAPPGERAPGLPADLEALCAELVRRDPELRPTGAEVLRRLGPEPPPRLGVAPARPEAPPLFGRDVERAALDEAFATAAAGTPVNVIVHGTSGIGKSSLVRGFLDDVADRAVVLAGRCYERESVPYKALDSLVDALCRYLVRLPPHELAALVPRDVAALVRVFPVLSPIERVAPVARAPAIPDAAELRRRGFAALRELLARLAERRPLVLFIDDLQWGDADSAVLLRDLVAPPDPPALLLVCCHRTENAADSPLLAILLARQPGVEVRELSLAPLTRDDARSLAGALLGAAPSADDDRADRIAREAGGNPFLLVQIAHHVLAGVGLDSGEVRFEDVMRARLDHLAAPARRLLELIAVAGCPVPREVARDAAGLTTLDEALAPLRAGQLVRTGGVRGGDAVECYHDRIRETVAALIDAPAAVAYHAELARAHEASGGADAEAIALHYHGAGRLDQAGAWAEVAADRAAAALAFDRAAELYRSALAWHPRAEAARRELTARLADALAGAGHGRAAADAYRTAAGGAERDVALARLQRAADQLLRAGYVDEGEAVLAEVLTAVGVRAPRSPGRLLAAIAVNRLRIRARGYRVRERPRERIPVDERIRIDACWSASTGLSIIDYLSAAYYQSEFLLGALRLGEPSRAASALALEAATLVTLDGPAADARSAALHAQARALAARAGDPRASATSTLMAAMGDIQVGRWRSALRQFGDAEAELRERCTDVGWELDTAQLLGCICQIRLGELDEAQRRVPQLLREAEARGDLYVTATIPGLHHLTWLAAGAVDELRAAVQTALSRWSPRGYHVQHFCAMQARVGAHLYDGDGAAAWRTVETDWPRLERSLMFRSHMARIEGWDLRARAALGAAAQRGAGGRPLAVARELAGRLERAATAHSSALASLLRAGIAATIGDRDRAAALYERAAATLDAMDMQGHVVAARRRRGALVGGAEGAALIATADAALAAERVVDPARLVAVLAPGP